MKTGLFCEGEYIVVLGIENRRSKSFPVDYVFRQSKDGTYLIVDIDAEGDRNGTPVISPGRPNWRYATHDEAKYYDELGEPFDSNELVGKAIGTYEIY